MSLLQKLGFSNVKTQSTENQHLIEGIAIVYDGEIIADLGRVKGQITSQFNINQPVLYADLLWEKLLESSKKTESQFKEIPKYPAVRRDFALLLDQSVQFSDIEKTAYQVDKKLLQNVDLFDVYEGKNLPDGKKSYAISFTFQDFKKTMTDKQVDKQMKKLQKSFEAELHAQLR
jgi:phenylalanyl-tRNA synthetase beta chain